MRQAAKLKTGRRERELNAMRRISEIDDRPLMVITSLGNTLLRADSPVFVRVGTNQYVKKTVADLKEGEQVIFGKEGIDVEAQRERIDERLMQGRKYRNAMASLFAEAGDDYTPTFRVELLRGTIERPDQWPAELTAAPIFLEKVIRNELDLTPEMHQLAAETIHARLLAGLTGTEIHVVSIRHIQNGWLTGNVIAPNDFKEVFTALGELSPGLTALSASPNFERDYHMYLGMRLSASLRLTNIMEGKGSLTSQPKPKVLHTSYLDESARRELDELVASFGDVISEKHRIADVIRVKPISKTQEVEIEKNREKLRKGVVTAKPDDVEIEILTPEDIIKRRSALHSLINDILVLYSEWRYSKATEPKDMKIIMTARRNGSDYFYERLGYQSFSDTIVWAVRKMQAAGINTEPYRRDLTDTKLQEQNRKYADELYSDMLNGTLDDLLGVEHGSMLKLFKEMAKYVATRPKEVLYAVHLLNLLNYGRQNGMKTEAIEQELALVNRLIARKGYAQDIFNPKIFLTKIIEQEEFATDLTRRGLLDRDDIIALSTGTDGIRLDRIIDRLYASAPELFVCPRNAILRTEEIRDLLIQMGLLDLWNQLSTKIGELQMRKISTNEPSVLPVIF